MRGRKRPTRHDPSDPMHWNKEHCIHRDHLKGMGISVKSTGRLDMIRQLYFENHKNTPQSEGEVPQDTININDNTSTEPSKEQNEMEKQVQQTNQNSGVTTLRKQILEGKDINLALLLCHKNEVPQPRTIFSKVLTVELSAPKDTL